MHDEPLVRIRLQGSSLPASAAWAEGLEVKLPYSMAALLGGDSTVWKDETVRSHARKAAVRLRERNAYLSRPPASGRLPISYRSVPSSLRQIIGRGIGRLYRYRQAHWADFPGWPLDLSADVAKDLGTVSFEKTDRTPVILSHDIDSSEGLDNLIKWFLPIEEALGARSANYIVPFAWPIDRALTSEVRARGHEIGIHGYDHSNRTPFASHAERTERIVAGARVAAEFGAVGYRAPSLVRSRALIRDLAGRYRYDSSIPTSGGLFPVPNNGCASARPWKIDGMWELPLSLPRDGSLRFLGHDPAQILEMWMNSANLIANSRGLVCLLTHCERSFSGNPPMLKCYRAFIERIASDNRFEFVRPVDLTARLDERSANVR